MQGRQPYRRRATAAVRVDRLERSRRRLAGSADGTLVAIESKFTEWLTPKPVRDRPFKNKYFPAEIGVWARVGLPDAQQFASRLQAGEIRFRHLHAAQLLKHALGLATHLNSRFRVFYLYFDAEGSESLAHREEVAQFQAEVGAELRFQAITYQALFRSLQAQRDAPASYLQYLRSRYFPAQP